MTDDQRQRYEAAMHSMQTAVKYEIEIKGENGAAADPKHLRVGINSAMADHAALVKLLLSKGVITEAEYYEAIVQGAEAEAQRYQQLLDPSGRLKFW